MHSPRFAPWLFALLVAFVAACGAHPPTTPSTVVIASPSGSLAPLTAANLVRVGDGTWSDTESPVPVSSRDPALGRRDALVTLVVFTDLQCPFCARLRPTIDALREAYGDNLRIVWKNRPLPFHQNAELAAEVAQGVFATSGAAAFWSFQAMAFEGQRDLSRENLLAWARAAGVNDIARFAKNLDDQVWAAKVAEDLRVAKSLDANGTPTCFINGMTLVGANPVDVFKQLIDQERAKAQALVAKGTPRDRVYVAASQANFALAPPAKDDEEDEKDDATVFKVPAGTAPARGSATALVTIVEFGDFQCPYCARVQPTLDALRTRYGADLRVLFRHEPLPFHGRAEPAAELALEARAEKGDAGFWAAHDLLYANQKALEDSDLAAYAKTLGLDATKVKNAITSHKYKPTIDADMDLADDVAANGTPHFFVNGRRLVGAQPQEKFVALIDEELTKARAKVNAGTAPAKVYELLVAQGVGAPEPERKSVALPKNAPSKGAAGAKVVIQEFADFQCPFCGRVEKTLDDVMKAYGNRVRLVWRNLPLPMHPDAPLASQAATEVYKQKGAVAFWKFHDRMLANQRDLKRATLDGYAQELGLDMKRWSAALDGETNKADVDADAAAANAAGISGTPAFLINGYYVSGALPFSKFRKIIERALAEAK